MKTKIPHDRVVGNGDLGRELRRPNQCECTVSGYGVFQLDHDWLTQQIRPRAIVANAPPYAISTHVAKGQSTEAGCLHQQHRWKLVAKDEFLEWVP